MKPKERHILYSEKITNETFFDDKNSLLKYIRGCVYTNYDENIVFIPSKNEENSVIFISLGNTVIKSGIITDKTIEIITQDIQNNTIVPNTKVIPLDELEIKFLKIILAKLLKLAFNDDEKYYQ